MAHSKCDLSLKAPAHSLISPFIFRAFRQPVWAKGSVCDFGAATIQQTGDSALWMHHRLQAGTAARTSKEGLNSSVGCAVAFRNLLSRARDSMLSGLKGTVWDKNHVLVIFFLVIFRCINIGKVFQFWRLQRFWFGFTQTPFGELVPGRNFRRRPSVAVAETLYSSARLWAAALAASWPARTTRAPSPAPVLQHNIESNSQKKTSRYIIFECHYCQCFSVNLVYHNLAGKCVCLLGRSGPENPGAQSQPLLWCMMKIIKQYILLIRQDFLDDS